MVHIIPQRRVGVYKYRTGGSAVSDLSARTRPLFIGQPRLRHEGSDVIPDWLNVYVSLEQTASKLKAFQPVTVHALLQTADYAAVVKRSSGAAWATLRVAQAPTRA